MLVAVAFFSPRIQFNSFKILSFSLVFTALGSLDRATFAFLFFFFSFQFSTSFETEIALKISIFFPLSQTTSLFEV